QNTVARHALAKCLGCRWRPSRVHGRALDLKAPLAHRRRFADSYESAKEEPYRRRQAERLIELEPDRPYRAREDLAGPPWSRFVRSSVVRFCSCQTIGHDLRCWPGIILHFGELRGCASDTIEERRCVE